MNISFLPSLIPTFDLTHCFLVALLALVMERLTGYPLWLHERFGHPVEWMGSIISRLEKRFNTPDKPAWNRTKGALILILMIVLILAISLPLTALIRTLPYSYVIEALLAVPLLAQRELKRFVLRVADALDNSIIEGRKAVSHIVGRDPSNLDETGVARAAIESLAENTSDAIIAPAFWLAIFGLPGIAVYKLINTADSMIAYKSKRYLTFGWATARLDDLVNLIGARLTGILFAGAQSLTNPMAAARALETIWRDARHHTSPNAGWPEAAMAGALSIRLGGPRFYNGMLTDLPWMGDGRAFLTPDDIRNALGLYSQTISLLAVLIFFCWLFV